MKISLSLTSIPFRTALMGAAFASLTLVGCDSEDSGSNPSQKEEVATAPENSSTDKKAGKKKPKKPKKKKTDTSEGEAGMQKTAKSEGVPETKNQGVESNSRDEGRFAHFGGIQRITPTVDKGNRIPTTPPNRVL